MKTKSIKCNFKNSRGFMLDARIDLPSDADIDNISTFIIFCHCFTCSKETITTFRLSRLLAENGFAVLRFDFTGLGNSEGDFSATTFTSTRDDLRCAIDFLSKNYRSPAFLIGHSLGGTTALSVAQQVDSVIGVVTVASPSQPKHVLHHFGHALTLLEQGIPASFEVAGTYYEIQPEFVENVRETDMRASLAKLDKPVLIFNIENDALVGENNANEIQAWVKAETRRVDIKDADHLLTSKVAVTEVSQIITRWLHNRLKMA